VPPLEVTFVASQIWTWLTEREEKQIPCGMLDSTLSIQELDQSSLDMPVPLESVFNVNRLQLRYGRGRCFSAADSDAKSRIVVG
jgi:hypothetical protein